MLTLVATQAAKAYTRTGSFTGAVWLEIGKKEGFWPKCRMEQENSLDGRKGVRIMLIKEHMIENSSDFHQGFWYKKTVEKFFRSVKLMQLHLLVQENNMRNNEQEQNGDIVSFLLEKKMFFFSTL